VHRIIVPTGSPDGHPDLRERRSTQREEQGEGCRRVPESECWRRWRTLPATVCEMLRRRSLERGDALEKKEEREGGVPRRDNENLLAFWNDTKASLRVRLRGATLE